MTSRTKTLVALACVAALAIVFALVPRLWPVPQTSAVAPPAVSAAPAAPAAPDSVTSVPTSTGVATTGSVDNVHSGTTLITVARGQAAHGKTPLVSHDALRVDGWALVDGKTLGARVVYRIDAGDWYQATSGQRRPDVAQAFKKPALAASGFVAHVPIAKLAVGRHTLRFWIVDGALRRPVDDPLILDIR